MTSILSHSRAAGIARDILFPTEPGRIEPLPEMSSLKLLDLALIDESPKNPRRHFDEAKLRDLAESIRTGGMIEPVLVRPVGDRFELASGHRRTRAARIAGLTAVPAIIREMDDRTFLEVLFVANAKREDVNALEEAEGYRAWMAETGEKVSDLALRLKLSTSVIYGRLKLLELSPAVQRALALNLMSIEQALELAKVPDHAGQHQALQNLFSLSPDALLSEDMPHNVDDDDADVDADNDDPDFDLQMAAVRARAEACRYSTHPFVYPRRPTIAELRNYLANNVYTQLFRAPFDVSSATLLPAAGACTTCEKRTGADGELFPEVGGHDVCRDRACFAAKEYAHIDHVVALQCERYNVPVHRISANYYLPGAAGVLRLGAYAVAAVESEANARGVYIDGPDRGTAVAIEVFESDRVSGKTTSAKEQREKLRAEAEKDRLKFDAAEAGVNELLAQVYAVVKDLGHASDDTILVPLLELAQVQELEETVMWLTGEPIPANLGMKQLTALILQPRDGFLKSSIVFRLAMAMAARESVVVTPTHTGKPEPLLLQIAEDLGIADAMEIFNTAKRDYLKAQKAKAKKTAKPKGNKACAPSPADDNLDTEDDDTATDD